MKRSNPVTEKKTKIRPFILMPPLSVFDVVVNIHERVTFYLESSFYNLTTIALHDWLTYSEMKNLAKEKFGLELANNYLPMGSLDQGLDILQIMRNIHVFVARFNYDLNQQVFIERRPDRGAKYLNTISIDSISCSIRQHGLGILNTTVNYTYQYLSKKFHIFSQFLFDDYIRSHLAKEKRWFKKHHKEPDVDNKYPYLRAMTFVKDIRKLGVSEVRVALPRGVEGDKYTHSAQQTAWTFSRLTSLAAQLQALTQPFGRRFARRRGKPFSTDSASSLLRSGTRWDTLGWSGAPG